MKKFFVLILLFNSCTSFEKELNTHLKNGLLTYRKTKQVNLNFVPGISLKKLALIKKSDSQRVLILKLNDNVTAAQIQSYSLAVKTYLDKDKYATLLKGKMYLSNPIKPKLQTINNHNYIITPFNLKVTEIDKFEFFLFDRDKFRKVLSKPIFVENITLN